MTDKFIEERLKHEHSEKMMFNKILVLEKQLLAEQAKNKKLIEIINSIVKYCAKTDTIEWFDYDNIKAIADEVNNAK